MKKLLLAFFCLMFLKSNSQIQFDSIGFCLNPVEILFTKVPKVYNGIDISMYQHNIDWEHFDTTISFVICKATEGINRVDLKLKSNWDRIPVVKGCYHFFRPQYSGIQQAKFFLDKANLDSGMIKPIIDVEPTYNWKYKKHRKKYVENLIQMVNYIEKETGQVPIIYTTAAFWDNYIAPYYGQKEHILWIADFRKTDSPKTPKSLPEWTIWQYSDRGKVKGIRPYVDKSICKDIKCLVWK